MEAKRLREFSTFRVFPFGSKHRDFDKFSSAVSWVAAHYHLAPGQTRELSTTGKLVLDGGTCEIKGSK